MYARGRLRLVSWNCQMGLRGAKLEALLALEPDVAVVQECAERDALALEAEGFRTLWVGGNPGKGLAVVARPRFELAVDGCHDPALAWFLPVDVRGGELDFRLLAVWSFGLRTTTAKRWALDRSLGHYAPFVAGVPAVVAGDFNHHPIWDTPSRPVFRRAVDVLERAGLRSAWHGLHGRAHGDEGCGTFYWYRHEDKPYHIDYCFTSGDLAVRSAEIGAATSWLGLSDHCPLVVDLARRPEPRR
jgi:exonuclease III